MLQRSCLRIDTKHLVALLIVIALWLCLVTNGVATESELTPHEEFIAQYRVLLRQGDSEALAELQASVRSEADAHIASHPEGSAIVQAMLNKALVMGMYGHGRGEEADRVFAEIIADHADSPLAPEVLFYRGRLLAWGFDGRRADEARATYLELVEKFPDSPKAPFALSYAAQSYLHVAKNEAKALQLYDKLFETYAGTQAEIEARHHLLDLAVDKGEYASAREQIDDFMKRLADAPDAAPAAKWAELLTVAVGDACLRMEDWERGKTVFEAVVSTYGDTEVSWRARYGLGRCEEGLGNADAALTAYRAVTDKWIVAAKAPGPRSLAGFVAFSLQGIARLSGHKPDLELAKLFVEKYRDTEAAVWIVSDLTRRRLYNHDFDGAVVFNERLLELGTPEALDAYMQNVNIFIDLHWAVITENRADIKEGFFPLLKELAFLSSRDQDRFRTACWQNRDKTTAIERVHGIQEFYERQDDADNVFRCRITLAQLYVEKGRYADAIELAQALREETSDAKILDELLALESRALFGGTRWDEAAALLRERLDATDDPALQAELLCMIGSCHFMLKEFPAARERFDAAVEASPSSVWSRKSRQFMSYMGKIEAHLSS